MHHVEFGYRIIVGVPDTACLVECNFHAYDFENEYYVCCLLTNIIRTKYRTESYVKNVTRDNLNTNKMRQINQTLEKMGMELCIYCPVAYNNWM